jgi:hypothetical protein
MNIKTLLKIVMNYFSVVLGVTIVSSLWLCCPGIGSAPAATGSYASLRGGWSAMAAT